MTLAQASAIIGTLFALLVALIGWLWKKLNDKVERLAEKVSDSKLAQFLGKDEEREKSWWEWRRMLESERLEWRGEVIKRLDAHAAELRSIATHEKRLERLERRVNGSA